MSWWVRDWFYDDDERTERDARRRLVGVVFLCLAVLAVLDLFTGLEWQVPPSPWAILLFTAVGVSRLGASYTEGRFRDVFGGLGGVAVGVAAVSFSASASPITSPSQVLLLTFFGTVGVGFLLHGGAVATGSHRTARVRCNELLSVLAVVVGLALVGLFVVSALNV